MHHWPGIKGETTQTVISGDDSSAFHPLQLFLFCFFCFRKSENAGKNWYRETKLLNSERESIQSLANKHEAGFQRGAHWNHRVLKVAVESRARSFYYLKPWPFFKIRLTLIVTTTHRLDRTVAMGNKMVVGLCQSHIDDVFSIWNINNDEATQFIERTNNLTWLLTAETSSTETTFPDTNIFIVVRFANECTLDEWSKSISNLLRHFSTRISQGCYTPRVKKGFIKGEAKN